MYLHRGSTASKAFTTTWVEQRNKLNLSSTLQRLNARREGRHNPRDLTHGKYRGWLCGGFGLDTRGCLHTCCDQLIMPAKRKGNRGGTVYMWSLPALAESWYAGVRWDFMEEMRGEWLVRFYFQYLSKKKKNPNQWLTVVLRSLTVPHMNFRVVYVENKSINKIFNTKAEDTQVYKSSVNGGAWLTWRSMWLLILGLRVRAPWWV